MSVNVFLLNGLNVKLTIFFMSWRFFFDLKFFFWLGVLIVHQLMKTKADVSTALDWRRNVNQIFVFDDLEQSVLW